ncbi:hypothetical protein PQJ75_05930 [Rhodoplanes sp. TEM]|uniref:Uncharacterized protein n=1 Tax=Rhodoplanes tepidamans TaxID=200616 RepID=A0ABT5J3C9_RHOTP|nr:MULTISPECIES: hypothetical protein [Rhodoplanes]MDC7784169.1 hypothetical protein [Rhodoplanes tepidamans]MDC7983264.1 hypothetical protein [Rhodoplanes sp. TEM]MDQ0356733.1 hypothetical protein [Rhodoplanes tepidamans]
MLRLDQIVRAGLSRVDTIRVVRTAVNPMLWLVGLTMPVSLLVVILVDDRSIRLVFAGLASIPVLATLVAYFIFVFRDPDRLQSEEYRIRQRAIQLLYRIGGTSEIVDVATQQPRLEIERRSEEAE